MHPDLTRDGFLVVRELLSRDEIGKIQEIARRGYELVEQGRAPERVQNFVSEWGGMHMQCMPEFFEDMDAVSAANQIVGDKASKFLGKCNIIWEACLFRRHKSKSNLVPWHIDADGAGTLGWDPCVNVWLPLVSVGREAPSLQVIRGSHAIMRHQPILPASNATRDEAYCSRFPESDRVIPDLEPGDALLFDHWLLHRSQPMTSDNMKQRISGEFRFAVSKPEAA